ncbi:MAG: Holliday junction branch migration DNA helicase RuvB [Rickettsiaceae bacterium H1]|nr:Holliday junction branch migration DNA helicase RuvB [Rickettsiaceae bacterium H1]
MKRDSLISPQVIEEDKRISVRPKKLADFVGQKDIKNNLEIFIKAALSRNESLDHILLHGPPGLGKTTLASIVANEMEVNFKATAGPLLKKPGDLAAILTSLEKKDVLFIDEIHHLNNNIEEILYPALEDYYLDLIVGEGPSARTVRIDLPKFTLIGATTRLGLISNPLRDRFGIPIKLEFYKPKELILLVQRAAEIIGIKISKDGACEIANRSRGTPRISLRLLRRVRDFTEIEQQLKFIDKEFVDYALAKMEIDKIGLDKSDYHYMKYIFDNYYNKPVGIGTIAAALSENKNTIEEIIEPYLLQIGLIQKTAKGRILTDKGIQYSLQISK